MRPSAEARFGIAALLALQLATSVAGVALLSRMSPAVDRILQENVYSTEAVEQMLSVLAAGGDPGAFREALDRARGNITEPEEREILDAIDDRAQEALAGDPQARRDVVGALRELGAVNRTSMQRADDSARILGLAGAWAMALLGFVSFLVSMVVYRRVESKLLAPIVEVDRVLGDVRAGNEYRRCVVRAESLAEGRLSENLNWLLDKRLVPAQSTSGDDALRDALLALIDERIDRPVLVGGADGRVVAVNQVALAQGSQARWADIATGVTAGQPPDGWSVTRLGSGTWIAEGPPG